MKNNIIESPLMNFWSAQNFSELVIAYYHSNGRKNLPWHNTKDAYAIWLSEIMLQQTQVNTVIPYYQKFLLKFPTVIDLANADQDEVLHLWSGLGYYSRARNLHKAAQIIRDEYAGSFPQEPQTLELLPGIGRSTAGAIAAFAFDKPSPILDGNVKRVLARCFAIEGWYGQSKVLKELWQLSEQLTPTTQTANYNQAMMDLGAVVCKRTKPDCSNCPLANKCIALQSDRFSELPHKKPKKARPSKSIYWLIRIKDNQVLLNKRPPSGIWGGLWSFCEVEQSEYQITNELKLTPILHKFSHYDLNIIPLLIPSASPLKVNKMPNISIMEPDSSHWYRLDKPMEIGLPAPVQTLLNKLNNQQKT